MADKTPNLSNLNTVDAHLSIFDRVSLVDASLNSIVGILKFISKINTSSESYKAKKSFNYHHFSDYDQLKFYA